MLRMGLGLSLSRHERMSRRVYVLLTFTFVVVIGHHSHRSRVSRDRALSSSSSVRRWPRARAPGTPRSDEETGRMNPRDSPTGPRGLRRGCELASPLSPRE
jgi:hypothetical protein